MTRQLSKSFGGHPAASAVAAFVRGVVQTTGGLFETKLAALRKFAVVIFCCIFFAVAFTITQPPIDGSVLSALGGALR